MTTDAPRPIEMSRPDITDDDIEHVTRVLRSGRLSIGPYVEQFEADFRAYVGTRHAVAVSSGTSGLHLCMRLAGVQPGREVITTPFSFVASANCILFERGTPVFVDIDEETFDIGADAIAAAVTPRTAAVLPVHVFGRPAEMDRICEIASRHGLVVVEDACEALGASYRGRNVGTFGKAAVFAFYPNKQITTGEGAIVTTDDPDWAAGLRALRNQGRGAMGGWLDHEQLGFNYRLDEMSAALGVSQLARVEDLIARRAAVAARYTARLTRVEGVIPLRPMRGTTRMSWFVYVVRLDHDLQRDAIAEHMAALGVPTRNYFPPIHLQPHYRSAFGYREGQFPVTERVSASTLALPFHAALDEAAIERVCAALEGAIARGSGLPRVSRRERDRVEGARAIAAEMSRAGEAVVSPLVRPPAVPQQPGRLEDTAAVPRVGTVSPPGPIPVRRLKVCHVAATTEGAVWLFEQVRGLRDRYGHDVTVILNGDKGKLVDRFEAAGIRVLVSDFEFLGVAHLTTVPRKIWALAGLLRRERFDVVQTHLFHSMVIGRIAAWLADVPVRLSMIAGPFHLEAYTPRWIDGSTQWMDSALIPSCEHTRTLYRGLGVRDARMRVIYYGPDHTKFDPAEHAAADLRAEFGWDPDVPLIGMVAYFYGELGVNRWTPPAVQGRSVKCQADLVAAMPMILKEFPRAKLVLVGSGWEEPGRQYLAKVHDQVRTMGLEDCVRFTGFRSDVPAILRTLDVAVQASASENLGGAIEALLMEAPTVATRVGGLVDAVVDDHTGQLAEPASPESLAAAISKLLRDRERARALARNGRERMLARFTLERTIADEDALYRELTARAPAGYRLWQTALRAAALAGVGAYLAARYRLVDARLLPKLDAGWRPWHFVRTRAFVARTAHAVIAAAERHRPRPRPAEAPRPVSAAPAALTPPAPGPPPAPSPPPVPNTPPPRLAAPAPAPPPTANEQFVSIAPIRPQPIGEPLRVAARMTLYRFYAFVGRQKLGWGIRRRIAESVRRIFGRTGR